MNETTQNTRNPRDVWNYSTKQWILFILIGLLITGGGAGLIFGTRAFSVPSTGAHPTGSTHPNLTITMIIIGILLLAIGAVMTIGGIRNAIRYRRN